jgi:hypothetical protein
MSEATSASNTLYDFDSSYWNEPHLIPKMHCKTIHHKRTTASACDGNTNVKEKKTGCMHRNIRI